MSKIPGLALTIAGADELPCLECGLLLAKLDRHLKGAHSLTSEQYKEKWGPEVAALCRNLQDLYTSQFSKAWQTPCELRKKPRHRLGEKERPASRTFLKSASPNYAWREVFRRVQAALPP